MKKDLTEIFINEIYSKPPNKNSEIKKIVYNHIDEKGSIDLADYSDYKISNNYGFRYIFAITLYRLTNNQVYTTMKIKTIKKTDEFSKLLSTSKQSSLKIESDRGKEFHTDIFQKTLKVKNIHHYSRFTDKGPSKRRTSCQNVT